MLCHVIILTLPKFTLHFHFVYLEFEIQNLIINVLEKPNSVLFLTIFNEKILGRAVMYCSTESEVMHEERRI